MNYEHNFMPLLNLEEILEWSQFDLYFKNTTQKNVFTGFLHESLKAFLTNFEFDAGKFRMLLEADKPFRKLIYKIIDKPVQLVELAMNENELLIYRVAAAYLVFSAIEDVITFID